MARQKLLPPIEIPPLEDPAFGGPGPYAASGLKDVCGTRINPDAVNWYKRRSYLTRPECAVRTCAHPDLEAWLGDIRSFDPRASVRQPPMSEWPLSAVMPRIVVWGEDLPFELEPMTYIIAYSNLNSNPASLPTRDWVTRLRDRFPEGSRLLLSFYGDRSLVLGLWAQTDFWWHPFLDQFDGVIAPDFSAFCNDPVPQYLFGERQQQIFLQEGSDAGRTVIPSIAWTTEASLRRQIELWTSLYPRVHTIQIDCDGTNVHPTLWKWRWLFALRKYCAGKPHIRWLLAGMTAGWAINKLNEIFPERNYTLQTSRAMYIHSLGRGTGGSAERKARVFRSQVRHFQDMRAGRETADTLPWPDHWPQFAEMKKTG